MLSVLRAQLCEGSKRKNENREITSTDYVLRIDNNATVIMHKKVSSALYLAFCQCVYVGSSPLHDSQAQDYTRHPKPPISACSSAMCYFR